MIEEKANFGYHVMASDNETSEKIVCSIVMELRHWCLGSSLQQNKGERLG